MLKINFRDSLHVRYILTNIFILHQDIIISTERDHPTHQMKLQILPGGCSENVLLKKKKCENQY